MDTIRKPREGKGQSRVFSVLVVDQKGFHANVCDVDDLKATIRLLNDTSLIFDPKPDGLSVLERDDHRGSDVLGGNTSKGPVIEDVAVLIHLYKSSAVVFLGPAKDLLHVRTI